MNKRPRPQSDFLSPLACRQETGHNMSSAAKSTKTRKRSVQSGKAGPSESEPPLTLVPRRGGGRIYPVELRPLVEAWPTTSLSRTLPLPGKRIQGETISLRHPPAPLGIILATLHKTVGPTCVCVIWVDKFVVEQVWSASPSRAPPPVEPRPQWSSQNRFSRASNPHVRAHSRRDGLAQSHQPPGGGGWGGADAQT